MAEKTNGLSRDLIIHPGETLHDVLMERGMTQKELAERTSASPKHISTIISGIKPISTAFAKKLEYALGVDSSFWINLQANYDKELLEFEEINNISDAELDILHHLDDIISYFTEMKWLSKNLNVAEKVLEMRKLLCVSNLTVIPKLSCNAAFRASTNTNIDVYVLFAWQRICEIKTETIIVNNDIDLHKLSARIPEIKKMMFLKAKDMQKQLTRLFADCGIAFSIVRHFSGAPVHGFIERNNSGKNILCLTIRRAYADIFWFTLFHEIGHLLNNDIKQRKLDFTFDESEEERLADEFAGNVLINQRAYIRFITTRDFSLPSIKRFAQNLEVPPYIVIGRLQKDKYLEYTSYASEKVRYVWE